MLLFPQQREHVHTGLRLDAVPQAHRHMDSGGLLRFHGFVAQRQPRFALKEMPYSGHGGCVFGQLLAFSEAEITAVRRSLLRSVRRMPWSLAESLSATAHTAGHCTMLRRRGASGQPAGAFNCQLPPAPALSSLGAAPGGSCMGVPPCGANKFARWCREEGLEGAFPPRSRARKLTKAAPLICTAQVRVEVQDHIPFMSIRSRRGEFSDGRGALSSFCQRRVSPK